MFVPIKARVVSSHSKKGIQEAAKETICFGETSIKSTSSDLTKIFSPLQRAITNSSKIS